MRRRRMSLKARVLAVTGRDVLRSPPLGSALRGEGLLGENDRSEPDTYIMQRWWILTNN